MKKSTNNNNNNNKNYDMSHRENTPLNTYMQVQMAGVHIKCLILLLILLCGGSDDAHA